MTWDAEGLRKIYGCVVEYELYQNWWWWGLLRLEYCTEGLDLGNSVQVFRIEPLSDLSCGSTSNQDMLYCVQRFSAQVGLLFGWVFDSLSLVIWSQVRNLTWRRSFKAFCVVVQIFCKIGWGRPDSPASWTLRWVILLLPREDFLSQFSCHAVTFVLTRVFQDIFDIQSSWTWWDHSQR